MKSLFLTLSLIFISFSLPAHAEPQRVISIGGALTEIIYGLHAEALLVGNDTTSYYPPEAQALPKVGYQRALSAEGILSLSPDLVIVTEEAGPPPVLKQLEAAGVSLLSVRASRSLEDVQTNIETIGKVLNREEEAQQLITSLKESSYALKQATADMPGKRVMFILQHGGGAPMVAGTNTAANSIISLSGAQNVVQNYEGYKPLTPEAATLLKPDVILVTNQGLEQAGGKESFLSLPGVALTPAAKQGHIIAMDSLLILGFGPRTAEAALELNQHFRHL